MNKDYYKILELSKGASESDIKKAFKKLSIKWHPDKWSSKSEKEQKEAEEKFKEVNEAYQVLSDPQKKSNYDRYGSADGPQGFSGFGDFGGFGGFDPFDLFNNMRGGGQRQRGPEPGRSLEYGINLSIEEIFNGCEKTITYGRKVRCKTCNGEGGTGVKTCPYCHGTGMITETKQHGFTIMQSSHPCNHCHGTGKTVEHVCKDCNGQGFKDITEKLKISVPAGKPNGFVLNFPNMGWESKDPRGENGDLRVVISYAVNPERYKFIGNEVYELMDVPYYDCILGTTIKRKLPSGKEVEFTIPTFCQDMDQITINGHGLNGSKYVIVVKAQMPRTISSEERELLSQIQKQHK
jgi:molecular chaperone DnaJ